jgi:transcriptional regulator with XRE-family HTH domain
MNDLGRIIKSMREEKGLSRKAVASGLHISAETVARWERNERCPDILAFINLAEILNISILDFLNKLTKLDPVLLDAPAGFERHKEPGRFA